MTDAITRSILARVDEVETESIARAVMFRELASCWYVYHSPAQVERILARTA